MDLRPERADILSLLSTDRIPYRAQERQAFGDERTCTNCRLHGACWRGEVQEGFPPNFTFRNGWDDERFIAHMKSVLAQVCGSFSPSDLRARMRLENRRVRERQAVREETGWDPEENT